MSTTHTTGSIAQTLGGRLAGKPDLPIKDLAALDQAGPESLTFIRDRSFLTQWGLSKAGAALVSERAEVPEAQANGRAFIYVADADLAMAQVLAMFDRGTRFPPVGVHPTSVIDPSARIAPTASIGPLCVVGPGATIADGCVLLSRVTLGAEVAIGPGTVLHPGVVVYDRCTIGAKCVLHANVNVGQDGFGYLPAPDGRGLLKIPHIGTVQIGHGVEIGAGSCIDRGKFGATTIGDGTKLDNLVQIGHNCRVGRCVIICGVSGMAGSVTVGDGAMIGGAVGITDGIHIGAGAKIGAKSGVMSDVPAGETWTGLPAAPHRDQMRTWSAAKQLPALLRDLRRVERLMQEVGGDIDADAVAAKRRSRGLDRRR